MKSIDKLAGPLAIHIPIAEHECYIDAYIELQEFDRLNILNASTEKTSIIFAGRSLLPEFPAIIFETFPNLSRVEMVFSGVEVLIEDHFVNATHLEYLRLERNSIQRIGKAALSRAVNLRILKLAANNIQQVENFAFAQLKLLDELHLEMNNLTSIKEETFAGASNLSALYLNDNQIEEIEDGALYLSALRKVYLQRNRLRSLSEDTFTGAQSLQLIDLSGNELTTLGETFSKCQQLSWLSLDDNKIQKVDWFEVADCPSLRLLSLKNNNVKLEPDENETVDENTDKKMAEARRKTRLEYLNLEDNNLYRQDFLRYLVALKNLRYLDLDNNPLIGIDGLEAIRATFPQFTQINLRNSPLHCDWLTKMSAVIRASNVYLETESTFKHAQQKKIDGMNCIQTEI